MIPRGQLDINYRDLLAGLKYCLLNSPESVTSSSLDESLYLSVRTGFHLTLKALNLPVGSEIIVTNINIPDMFTIIAAHGLKAVPVPVDKHSLSISIHDVERAITPRTRALLVTHLFGAITPMDELINLAQQHGLIVFEDCAQAYAGNSYQGHPRTDVVMFSFGLIKTNTAISGAQLIINNPELSRKVIELINGLPVQPTRIFRKKLVKALLIKLLTERSVYTAFYHLIKLAGKDFDAVLSGFTRGFPGADLLQKINYRPCPANLKLLVRKIIGFDEATLDKRRNLAFDVTQCLPENMRIGNGNKRHTYWVWPVVSNHPHRLIEHLRAQGFDATQKASSLIKIEPDRPIANNDLVLEDLVYLPMYINMTTKQRSKLSRLLSIAH
ncbi:dTDP-4-amino-4,6-dideoxygalactose transaminase [Mucilaginibacter yixingensis]|uniref:dTDP-4-amino-4,6-dideoxygalactose transaminase n=1 Tax=Mucilaginibacter yixingensis TaxID=1295612 RepID=A0A2T5J7E2_9SPHI|nr:aminotransferase class V-fold PLP-dependent enzyme [Mucilaginibacter yixingensis]PTQ95001.1 dTDP-4-amino-4,6-dideoxygalactose transaminase [Mucilaginibacter yixingensis]